MSWILQKFDLDLFSSRRNTAVSGVMLKQELRFAKFFDSIISIYINILYCAASSKIVAKLCRKHIGIEGGGQDEALSAAATVSNSRCNHH